MSDNLIKISNPNEFSVGVKLMDGIQQRNITSKSFTFLDIKEVYFIDSICTLFKKGILVIDSDEVNQNLGLVEIVEEGSDEHLRKILTNNSKGAILKMTSELKKITEKHIIDKVIKIAKELDLPTSKGKVIEEVFNISLVDEIETGNKVK